jgi:hypothetical protein
VSKCFLVDSCQNIKMKNTASNLQVGELVVVNTKSLHKGEIGRVHSFTAKKIRVIFSDMTMVAFYEKSLCKAQTPHLHHPRLLPAYVLQCGTCDKDTKQNAIILKAILLELINIFETDK